MLIVAKRESVRDGGQNGAAPDADAVAMGINVCGISMIGVDMLSPLRQGSLGKRHVDMARRSRSSQANH
jgi:hypothetical protein